MVEGFGVDTRTPTEGRLRARRPATVGPVTGGSRLGPSSPPTTVCSRRPDVFLSRRLVTGGPLCRTRDPWWCSTPGPCRPRRGLWSFFNPPPHPFSTPKPPTGRTPDRCSRTSTREGIGRSQRRTHFTPTVCLRNPLVVSVSRTRHTRELCAAGPVGRVSQQVPVRYVPRSVGRCSFWSLLTPPRSKSSHNHVYLPYSSRPTPSSP